MIYETNCCRFVYDITILSFLTCQGIITESKSGRRAILADRVIDCTGDADVAHFAGAEYRLTPKDEALGMTTILNLSGVHKTEFLEYVKSKPATYADWSRVWNQVTISVIQ